MSNAIERAAARVMASHLERQRTYNLYKRHIKDAKDSKELEEDRNFQQLRDNMQLARANHEAALHSYDAISAHPPLNI